MTQALIMRDRRIEDFRATTAGHKPLSLRRRKCACGKAVTAKQLAQYGKCDMCRVAK